MSRRAARIVRGALSGAFFFLYGLFALPFAPLVPILPRRWGRAAVRMFYRLFVISARLTRLFRVAYAPGAREALAGLRGKIVVMNHVSLIDICILLSAIPDAVCIAKAAAKRNPFLAAVVRGLFIANDAGAERALAAARARLAEGVYVVVFPQGTRGGAKLHRGAARLALACGAEIAAAHVAYDPVPLAKGQPWWDVGDREILVQLSYRGRLAPDGANDHRRAVSLTEQIKEKIR